MSAFTKELDYLLNDLALCVDSVLEDKLDEEEEHFKKFDKCNADREKIDNFIIPYLNKTVYVDKDHQSIFNEKVEEAYLSLGRFGYDSNLSKSL